MNELNSFKEAPDEYPELTAKLTVIPKIDESWKALDLKVPEEAKEILCPSDDNKKEEQPQQRGVSSIKLVQDPEGKSFLLVHRQELGEAISMLVLSFKAALERFGIHVEGILCPEEDKTGPACPSAIHPQLKEFAMWLANPSAIDWKSSKLDLSDISNFVNEVVLHGRQPYLSIKSVNSRSTMYIHSMKNIIMRLFLINRDQWIKAFWHFIPETQRNKVTIRYHALKKFESILVKAELNEMPKEWNELREQQVRYLESYNDLSGSYIEYKLRKSSERVVKMLGKPLLKVLYDRLKIRSEIYHRMKKKTAVKLSEVLLEGLRRDMPSCLAYAPVCALHRRNFFREVASIEKLPLKIKDDPVGLPFGCHTMADYARYCKQNEDLSPAREEDSIIKALDLDIQAE